jgi:hypothetical protein
VETGYHTNPDDALALKDDTFVQAAMKGVEKGYRLHKAGKSCVPFSITSVPDVSGPRGGPAIPGKIYFAGFPQFPLSWKLENVSCSTGNTCTGLTGTYSSEVPSPLSFTFSCSGSSSTTTVSTWKSTLIDADGVKTGSVEHKLTCTPSSTASAKGIPPAEHASISLNEL